MKNLKISVKLLVSFAVVIFFSISIGVVGIVGMYMMNVADDGLYNGNYLPTVMAGDISQMVVEQRVYMRGFIVYDSIKDADDYKNTESGLERSKAEMDTLLSEYKETIVNPEDKTTFDEFVNLYSNDWVPYMDELNGHGKANEKEAAKALLATKGTQISDIMNVLTDKLQEINLSDGKKAVDGNTRLFTTMTFVNTAVLVVSVAIAMFFAIYISKLISAPLQTLTSFMKTAGTTGNITLRPEDVKNIEMFSQAKDETGQCIASTASFIKHITEIAEDLGSVADGDLTTHIHILSGEDVLGVATQKMVDNLNHMFSEINNSTAQVSTGSKQIADGAQSLAQGSTQQAAAVEQLSSSINEIALKTQENAEKATRAADLSGAIRQNAQKGSEQMGHMMEAVKEINDASNSINKVIKVIDDIAFQTNILALNAAVEAARAGQHGKGFAVVAEEVRNLAAKSAAAARDTGGLIANSIEKAQLGAKIADETAASLNLIVNGINESTEIVTDIARSSEEQSAGIKQINTGIDQVAQVVQQNSATAEESAAASEEMSGQANMLEELIGQFKLKNAGVSRRSIPSSSNSQQKRLTMPERTLSISSASNGDFGKY